MLSRAPTAPPSLHRVAARPLGLVLIVLAASMAACAPAGLLAGEPLAAGRMGLAALICAAFGGAGLIWGRGAPQQIGRREAMLIVALSWLAAGLFGGLPFVVAGQMPIWDAFFESVSGFTTTGGTILGEIEGTLDPATHLWRVATHWLGGLGIVVLFVALFPALGVGGKHLFRTEAAGPSGGGGLSPRIQDTAAVLWRVYVGLTALEFLALLAAGLPWFEALTHALSTMGTGGFSTQNGSIADFNSLRVEAVITLFMVIAGINFGLFYEIWSNKARGLRTVWRNAELRVYLGLFIAVTLLITADIAWRRYDGQLGLSLRYASFQVAAIMTTTGFGTADFEQWPTLSRSLLTLLYFTGGSAGSTAGGLKLIRVIIIAKLIFNEVQRSYRPALVAPVRVQGKAIAPGVVTEVLAYAALFGATVLLGAVGVAALEPDVDLLTAAYASLACVSNVGPGLGEVGPTDNFGFFAPGTKLLLSLLMYIGRLEGFVFLALLAPGFWRR